MINLAGKEGRNYITIDTCLHSVNFKGLNKIEKMIYDCTIIEGLSTVVTCEEIAEMTNIVKCLYDGKIGKSDVFGLKNVKLG